MARCSGFARLPQPAVQADDLVETAVQVDHVAAAGTLVQAVDVLGDEQRQRAGRLPRGEGVVRRARARRREARPAGMAARPVAPVGRGVVDERLVHHRRPALPVALGRRGNRESRSACCSPRRSARTRADAARSSRAVRRPCRPCGVGAGRSCRHHRQLRRPAPAQVGCLADPTKKAAWREPGGFLQSMAMILSRPCPHPPAFQPVPHPPDPPPAHA